MKETLGNSEGEQASSNTEDSGVSCPTCGNTFDSEQGMKSHHTQAHGESLVKIERVCEECGEKYQTELGYADQSRFCSRECWNSWQKGRSKPSLSGENNPSWKGGKVTLECEWCDDPYKIDPHAADESRFCSRECYGAWQKENLTGEDHHNWKGGKDTLECEVCGSEFEVKPSKSGKRRFCSRICHNTFRKGQTVPHLQDGNDCKPPTFSGENHPSWKGGKVTLECEVCGDEFQVKASHADDRRTCSYECKGDLQSREITGEDHPRWKEKQALECDLCGEEYTVEPHREDETRFCSDECWKKYISVERIVVECDHCEDEFTIPATKVEERRFCSQECYGEWISIHRTGQDSPNWRGGKSIYDAVKKQFHGPSWQTRRKHHRQQEPKCQVCGTIEDLDVHHIVPIMSGGTNDEWNLMTLCVSCHNRAEAFTREYIEPVLIED